jgi:DNA-binding MarR family transcriptional regulator
LQAFVDTYRRRELQDILGIGRGLGRVKLLLLLLEGPHTLSGIAEARGIDAPYATVIVDKLEALGLVERTAHPDDHRRKLVQLTSAGKKAAILSRRMLAEPPSSFSSLSKTDLLHLEQLVEKLTTTRAKDPLDHR